MKSLWNVVSLLALSGALSQPVFAGEVLRGRLEFDTWVFWSEVELRAGHYTLAIEIKSASARAILRSEEGKVDIFVPFGILAGAESGRSQVCMSLQKDRWEVRSVNLPHLGLSLLFSPRDKAESRETPQWKCVPIAFDGLGTA